MLSLEHQYCTVWRSRGNVCGSIVIKTVQVTLIYIRATNLLRVLEIKIPDGTMSVYHVTTNLLLDLA